MTEERQLRLTSLSNDVVPIFDPGHNHAFDSINYSKI